MSEGKFRPDDVRLEVWGPGDLPLLRRLLGDAATMTHLGGPESEEQLVKRQARYEGMADGARGSMYKVLDAATGEPLGSVGYWESSSNDETVWETGWHTLPGAQGRGVATAAMRALIERLRADGRHRWLYAFPGVDNGPSNALCRRLGFELLGAGDYEYPPGNPMRCNDWRLDLRAEP
jgi:RimJ/RimL family protein N-acetyltransferase